MVDPDDDMDTNIKKVYGAPGTVKLDEKGWCKFGILLSVEDKDYYGFVSFIKIMDNAIRFRISKESEEVNVGPNLDPADQAKIVEGYERAIRLEVQDSFRLWHAQE